MEPEPAFKQALFNPPAFPSATANGFGITPGMTLRDYFAAGAFCLSGDIELDAKLAYEIADAMLEERAGK